MNEEVQKKGESLAQPTPTLLISLPSPYAFRLIVSFIHSFEGACITAEWAVHQSAKKNKSGGEVGLNYITAHSFVV